MAHLRRALTVTNVYRKTFPLGRATEDEIVTTNRLILILRGTMDYTIEGKKIRIKAGTQFLVPAWVRRVWSVPRNGSCEIIWCEFDEAGGEGNWGGFCRRTLTTSELASVKKQYFALLKLFPRIWEASNDGWARLRLEAELKAMLAGFWENAEWSLGSAGTQDIHPKVKEALRWLAAHYLEKQALGEFYNQTGMSRNYFRLLFAEAMQCSPREYIERLRLRHGRYLLHETDWQLKRIAAACGYDDPLYFSRQYRRFWRYAPSKERQL